MSEVLDILEKLGYGNLRSFSGYYRVNPLYRPSSNKGVLSVNAGNGCFNDWARQGTSEGSGDLIKLVSIHLNCPYKKAKEWLTNEKYEVEETSSKNSELAANYEQIGIDIPFFCLSNLGKINKNTEYWEQRGVRRETLDGFCSGIDDGIERGKMYNRYVFPIFDPQKKSILGFAGRDITGKSPIKWKLIGGKGNWIYPMFLHKEDILKKSEIILLESIGDMLSLRQAGVNNTVVCFGLSINQQITSFLINSRIRSIIISFNNDSHNNFSGNKASMKTLRRIEKITEKKIRICLPDSQNDFGEMDPNQIEKWAYKNEISI